MDIENGLSHRGGQVFLARLTGTLIAGMLAFAFVGSAAAVTLAVPDADAGLLACYASAGDVAIALTPGSG